MSGPGHETAPAPVPGASRRPWPRVDRQALQAGRTARLAQWMARRDVDHLLLTGPDQIRYATDFRAQLVSESTDWYAAVVDAYGEGDIFVPYVDAAAPGPALPHKMRGIFPLPSWAPAACHPRQWVRAVAAVLRARHAHHVAYDSLDAGILHDLAAELPQVRFTPCAAELFAIRAVKDPLEISLVEAACRINAAALQAALDGARPGMSDHELLAVAAAHQHDSGAEFVTHSVCNVRKGTGGWFADGAVLQEGEPFFLDTGCHGHGGYASDAARTGWLGEPAPAVRRAWRSLLTAYEAGQEAARCGVRVSRIHEAMNDCLVRQGLPPTPYGTGHGIGLRCCELPTIHSASLTDHDDVLRSGHVIALEPETAVESEGRVYVLKVEDNFAVEEQGLRLLTTPSTTWPD
ncbi:M24 family metallopeptidase [Streptomyces sp. NPDC003470]